MAEVTMSYATPEDLAAESAARKAEDQALWDAIKALQPVPPEPDPYEEELYVALTGHDGNKGDIDHPFRTVRYGCSKLGPSVRLSIRDGLYAEEISSPPGGTEAQPACVRAYPSERVTLQPLAGAYRCLSLEDRRSAYLRFEGLHLDGKNVTYDVVKFTYGGSDKLNVAHHITLQGCELFNAVGQGILITDTSHHNLLEACVIHDIALQSMSDFAHGFYVQGADNVFRNVEVYRCAGSAGQNYSGYGATANRNLYEDCHFHDCALGGPQKRPMFTLATGSGARAVNCRVVGGQYAQRGVDFMGSCVDMEFTGGYVGGFPEIGILIEANATRTKVTHVQYGQNGTNCKNQGNGSIITP